MATPSSRHSLKYPYGLFHECDGELFDRNEWYRNSEEANQAAAEEAAMGRYPVWVLRVTSSFDEKGERTPWMNRKRK